MPVDIDRAVTYIRLHGNVFEGNSLDWLLGEGLALSAEQEQQFFAGQRSDGGWPPFWASDYSSLDATCYRLAQADGLQMSVWNPEFKHAVAFLRSRQRTDGSWEEDEAVGELAPRWAKPGELATRLYLIANCGWRLANSTSAGGAFVSTDAAAQRAGRYLEQRVQEDGSLPSFLHTHWLAVGLWIRLGADALAARTLDYLATQMSDDVPASSLAWMLTTLAGIGIDPNHAPIQQATTLLISQQRTDGRWESEDGPERDPYVTVEALRALIQWGMA